MDTEEQGCTKCQVDVILRCVCGVSGKSQDSKHALNVPITCGFQNLQIHEIVRNNVCLSVKSNSLYWKNIYEFRLKIL